MRRGNAAAQVLVFLAVTLLVIALSPVIVLVGEPVRRRYLRSEVGDGLPPRRSPASRRHGLAIAVIENPLFIALTAPVRWVIDRVGSGRLGGFGGRADPWPPPAGVREPRRPKPSPPGGAIALAEPRQQHLPRKLKSLLTTLSGQTRDLGSWLGRQASLLRARVTRRARGWAG